MTYRPVPFAGFAGGLNLRDQPDVVGEQYAIDLLNVTFAQEGAVQQRDGYGQLTTLEGTNRYDSLAAFYKADGTRQLVCGAGSRLDAISTAGAVTVTAAPTASPHFFARMGTPTSERLYIANGTDTVRYWDGSSFTTPAYTGTTPTGMFVAVTPWDNRLVCARTATNPSRVLFSDAGDPSTFGANNYVDVNPGDGEAITGLVGWREFLFVFKESKVFVFYGTSLASDGVTPVFNYRAVTNNVGAVSPRAIAPAPEGVYFMHRTGLFRTTGGEPEKLSDIIEPFFLGSAGDFYQGGTLNHNQITLAAATWHSHRIYLAVPSGSSTSNNRLLVFDAQHGWWTLWDIPAAALVSFRVGDTPELVFAYAAGPNHLGRHSSSYTTDSGAGITSRWRSGWFDYGDTTDKTLRESKLWGKGQLTLGIGRDFQSSSFATAVNFTTGIDTWGDGTGTDTWGDGTGTDTWSAGRNLLPKLVRRAVRGTVFSIELANSGSHTWTVDRLTNHLREAKRPTTVRTDS